MMQQPRPGIATDNVNIQDSASHAYSAAGQKDFLKASASDKDTSSAVLPGLTISDNANANAGSQSTDSQSSNQTASQSADQSGGEQNQKTMDDPYTRMAIARIFNFTAPSSAGGESSIAGVHAGESEEEEQHEAPQTQRGADGTVKATTPRPKAGGGSSSTVKSMAAAERAGAVAQQSQARSVAP